MYAWLIYNMDGNYWDEMLMHSATVIPWPMAYAVSTDLDLMYCAGGPL